MIKLNNISKGLISLLLLLFLQGCDTKVEDKQEQTNAIKDRKISLNNITVSDYDFTMNNQSAVNINILQDDNNYFTITVLKSKFKKGFKFLLNKDNYNNISKEVEVTATFTNDTFNLIPKHNQDCFISFEILEYDKVTKKAVVKISTTVANINNYNDSIGFNNAEFTFTNTDEKPYFDLLTKQFNNQVTIKKKSLSKRNIDLVVKSLYDNYNINATNEYNKDLCVNDNFCEIYADTVQIQAVKAMIDPLSSIKVTPKYYQQVCSAVLIAISGANKELAEQTITQYFNYASKNGDVRTEVLGIEMKVIANSNGLLECGFYKR